MKRGEKCCICGKPIGKEKYVEYKCIMQEPVKKLVFRGVVHYWCYYNLPYNVARRKEWGKKGK